jgi:D-inositol-3-phosphate glycosyltransferase
MSVYIRELSRELGWRGHLVDIYTRLHGPSCDRRVDLCENVRLVHLGVGADGEVNKLALYERLADFFRELEAFRTREGHRYDLIHSHYWLSGRVGQWAQERWGVPHILSFHTLGAVKNAIEGVEDEPRLRISMERSLANRCHRVLAGSDRERDYLMRYYGVSPNRVGVIPCGVNLERFHPVEKRKARQQLELADNGPILLYVGRFAPVKGIDRLLGAMAYLKHHPELKLMIVGGDGRHTPEHRALKRLTVELGIQECVFFAGRIEQRTLPIYYSAADALVVPSHYESFGLVALEALACGTPVVATKVGAMESVLDPGKTGYVVAEASPRLLADAIEAFVLRGPAGTIPPDRVRASVLHRAWSDVASTVVGEYLSVTGRDRIVCTYDPSRNGSFIQTVPHS